jgi:hypothetical protein
MNYSEKFKQAVRRIDGQHNTPTSKDHHFKTYNVLKGDKVVAWNVNYDEAITLSLSVRKKLKRINETDETGKLLYDITHITIKEVL